nr:alpha/beta hydrolase [FCB group bacterium]
MGLLDTVLSSFKSKSVEDLPQVSAYSFGDVLYPYETHYFDIDELHIAYVEKGEGMPILFLHGQGSSINVFTPVLAGFHDHYRVLALDFPGFGKSGKKKICTNRREYNKLLSAFINEVGGESCWIVGHSLGGLISILVAEENPQL